MSPVLAWTLRYVAIASICFTLPALPAPVRPFVVVLVIFASWALLASDIKQDEKNDRPDLRDVRLLAPTRRSRYRPR